MLELIGLSKSWPGFAIEASLELGRGEIAALLGPSGSGKSTLLRLAAGLESPDSGRVVVGGVDVTGMPPGRRGIGLVFQDYALFPHMSVRRNIEYGPRMGGAGRRERRLAAEAIALSFEIAGLLERSPYSLSGGEQQRVALARALAARPSILLLDEPLSSLDASLRRRLRVEIGERLKAAGMTALLVTHDAEEALAVADTICLMRGGAIDSKGPPEALYESPPTAWSAAFLGRGPVLEILALEGGGPSPVARTAIGAFDCAGAPPVPVAPLPAAAPGSPRMSLFFPASAPRPATRTPPPREGSGGDVARNRIRGRVASDSFAGSCRRVSLACPIVSGGELILELELPPSFKPAIGELLELRVDSGLCRILPGSPS